MSRYIDADALKANVPNTNVDIFENCRNCSTLTDWQVKELIDKMPTVDAVPVRHGHWEIVPNDENTDGYYKMRCSVCGETLWGIQSEELYCCKCGSKMDGAD